jgi:hypothetical protein
MVQQLNVRYDLLPKTALMRRFLVAVVLLVSARTAAAQRVTSYGVSAGALSERGTDVTAAFNVSAGFTLGIPLLAMLQRSVAELEGATITGTLRDVSFAALAAWEPFGGYIVLGAGGSVHDVRRDVLNEDDTRKTRFGPTGVAGFRIPIAGNAVSLEFLARIDVIDTEPQYAALFGARLRPGRDNTLQRGEPMAPQAAAQRAAVWNDVVMQLILLQQSLESFTRIKEIDTGIELEFNSASVTLYDDVAKTARVLAAADPPVIITVLAPNAGRTAAAVTAGSFPAERVRMQRDTRVYLRVEH